MRTSFGSRRPVVCFEGDGVPPGLPGDATPPAAPAAPLAAPAPDGITLSKAEYGQLMGTIAQLQAALDSQAQAPNTPEPQIDPNEFNQLTNAQMMQLMMDQVNKQVGQPLLNSIMQLAVKEELRECQSNHPDFNTYKDDVYQEAQKNTHLSLEQAYYIVKARKTGTAPPPTPPAVNPPAAPVGERPGVTPSSTTTNPNLSVKDAAAAALKALQYKD